MKTASSEDIKLMVEFCEYMLGLLKVSGEGGALGVARVRAAMERVRDATEFVMEEGEEE